MKKISIIFLFFSLSGVAQVTTTVEKQTLEAYRLKNYTTLKGSLSTLLANYLASRDVLSLDDFINNPVVDLSTYSQEVTSLATLKGLELLAPNLKQFILPAQTTSLLGETSINLTNWKKLEVLIQGHSGVQLFYGDISGLTTLKRISLVGDNNKSNRIVLPPLSANTGLTFVRLNGTAMRDITATTVGNLQLCPLLEEFRLIYAGVTSAPLVAAVDAVLAGLKTQKQNGGAIKTIDFTGMPAPTGGTSNANYTYLIANGVSVTLGTL